LRKSLTYPQIIQPGRKTSTAGYIQRKVLHFFVFFPKDKITKLPKEFHYKIESRPEMIKIAQEEKKEEKVLGQGGTI
jgi:hypothetical protein